MDDGSHGEGLDGAWKAWARQAAQPHLAQLLEDLPGVTGAILASSDGYELASAGHADLPESQLAGMASAMQGLGQAMARETGLLHCRDIIVDSEAGRIVLMSVPGAVPHLVLMTIVTGPSAFGQLLLQCRNCCVAMGSHFVGGGTAPAADTQQTQ